MSNPVVVIKRREYGVKTPPPDVSRLRAYENSMMLRMIAYLSDGPRSLMEAYDFFCNNQSVKVKVDGLVELKVIEYVVIGTRRYLQLTEYGKRLSGPVREMLDVINGAEEARKE